MGDDNTTLSAEEIERRRSGKSTPTVLQICDSHEALRASRKALIDALAVIRDLPSEHDLLFNAMAKAMWYLANDVLARESVRDETEEPRPVSDDLRDR